MSVDPHYLYIIIEDDPNGMKLVRALNEHKSYYSSNKRVRAYTQAGHAKNALKLFGKGKILRVNLSDGEIL